MRALFWKGGTSQDVCEMREVTLFPSQGGGEKSTGVMDLIMIDATQGREVTQRGEDARELILGYGAGWWTWA